MCQRSAECWLMLKEGGQKVGKAQEQVDVVVDVEKNQKDHAPQ